MSHFAGVPHLSPLFMLTSAPTARDCCRSYAQVEQMMPGSLMG